MVEFDLKNFKLISFSPYIYRLFKNHHDTYLMEVTCGTHGVWEVRIQLTQDEILLYKNEGNKGLEKQQISFLITVIIPITGKDI